MASHIEIQRLAADPAAVRTLALHLLRLEGAHWTDWELDFLDNMAGHRGPEPLSLRQSEVLAELRDNARSYAKVDGLSVPALIRQCFEARMDLEEDEEAFVASLHAGRASALKRRELLRLMLIARRLGLIEGYINLG